MADKDLTVHLKADDKITPAAKKAADALKKLEQKPVEVEVDADVSGVLQAFDQLTAEAKETAEAAEKLGRALGPELAAKADTTAIVQDLKQAGLTIDQITTNADELAAKLKEVSDADVGGKLGANLGTARGKIDEMSDSARGANSALANMIGNTSQDLGTMSGLTGSAGVALGQLGEYAADAALGGEKLSSSLRSMAAVAVPIAAVTIAVSALGSIFAAAAERAKRAAQYIGMFADAAGDVDKVTDSIADMSEELSRFNADARTPLGGFVEGVSQAAKAIPGLGGLIGDAGQNISDVIATFNQLEISASEVAEAVLKGGSAWDSLAVDIDAAREAGQITSAQHKAAIQVLQELRDAQAASLEVLEFTTGATEDLTAATGDAIVKTAGLLGVMRSLKTVAGVAGAARAMEEFNRAVASTDFKAAELEGGLAGMTAFSDQFFSLARIAADNEVAIDGFTASLKENGKTFDLNTEKGRANQEALEGVAATLDTQLAAAYDDADGDMDTFKRNADVISQTTLARLATELGLNADETMELGRQLGLLPEDIETRYNLAGDAEAKMKLGLLQGAIDNLPDNVNTTVTQQIIAGDYQGALDTVNNYYANHPAKLPVQPYLKSSTLYYNPGTGITPTAVGPTPTGLSATPTAAAVAPAAMSPITIRVPALSMPSITINAGVVGNRFDVDRTVTKALRRHQRLNGVRP